MGKYDQYLVGLNAEPTSQPSNSGNGKYDKYLTGLPESLNTSVDKKPMVNPALREAISRVPGLLEKLAPVIPGLEPLTTVKELLPTANTIKEGFPKVAGNIAEKLGGMGVNPNVSATLTTPIAIAPELASSAMGLGEVLAGKSVLSQAIRNTPRNLSPRYDVLNEAAGISKNLPVSKGSIPKYPGLNGLPSNVPPPQAPAISPMSYPKEINPFLNFARMRLEGLGKKLHPQELNDYKSIINTAMRDNKITPGTDQFAVATRLKGQATKLLNKAVLGRAELDQIYALSKKLRIAPEVAKQLWNYIGPKLRWGVIGVP